MLSAIPRRTLLIDYSQRTCDMCCKFIDQEAQINVVHPCFSLQSGWYDGNHLCERCYLRARLEGLV